MLQHFVLLPTFLILELSSNYIDQIFFPLTMDVLGQHYVPNCTYSLMFQSSFYSGG